jgi:hypothetical protein
LYYNSLIYCLGSMADILGQFFGGDSPFGGGGGGGHPFGGFGGLFGHSMGGGGRNRRRKGDDIAHPLK